MDPLQTLPPVQTPAPGVRLQVLPEPRFKRALLHLHFDLPMDDGRAARTLLTPVLQQGSAACPSRRLLARALQEAYGASLHLDAERAGERHRVTLALSWVGERFLPPDADVLARMLELARQVLWEPLRGEDGAPFREDRLERERRQLLHEIASRKDDKARWAEERFLATMCAGEPYGMHSWGSEQAVQGVTAADLEAERLRLLEQAEVTAFAVGPVAAEPVAAWLAERFSQRAEPKPLPPSVRRDAGELREVRESLAMDQAQFHLGFRVPAYDSLEERTAAGMAASVLGGGAHGRLFRIVREERSLAYGIYASLRGLKGLLTVAAGIDAAAYEEVRDETLRQVQALATGGPSEEEMALARTNALDRLAALGDAPHATISYLEREALLGTGFAPAERAAALRACTPGQVAAAAAGWRADTAYLLAPAEQPAATA